MDVLATRKTGSGVHDFLQDHVRALLHIVVREPHNSIALPLEPKGVDRVLGLGFVMRVAVDLHHKPAGR